MLFHKEDEIIILWKISLIYFNVMYKCYKYLTPYLWNTDIISEIIFFKFKTVLIEPFIVPFLYFFILFIANTIFWILSNLWKPNISIYIDTEIDKLFAYTLRNKRTR